MCEHCMKGKARQKNVPRHNERKKTRKGVLTYWDISSMKKKSQGGTKFWNLVVDDSTEMKFSIFLKKKSDLPNEGVNLVKKVKNRH